MRLFDACRCASQFYVEAQVEYVPRPHVSFGLKMRGVTRGFPTKTCMPSTLLNFDACKTLVACSRGGTRGGKISNVGSSRKTCPFRSCRVRVLKTYELRELHYVNFDVQTYAVTNPSKASANKRICPSQELLCAGLPAET